MPELKKRPNTAADYDGTTGHKVTLKTEDANGVVLIGQARYNGKNLVPAGQSVASITLTIAGGKKRLILVLNMPQGSTGVLREDAPNSEVNLDLGADDAESIVIHGS